MQACWAAVLKLLAAKSPNARTRSRSQEPECSHEVPSTMTSQKEPNPHYSRPATARRESFERPFSDAFDREAHVKGSKLSPFSHFVLFVLPTIL